MTIQEIFNEVGMNTATVAPVITQDGEVTDWFRAWNNKDRIQVSLHKDVVSSIKAKKNPNLAYKSEEKVSKASAKKYMSHIIFEPKIVEGSVDLF